MERRKFLKATLSSATGALMIPTFIPSSVIGKNPPSDKIQVGQIGFGRIARGMDTRSMMRRDDERLIAVCDENDDQTFS